MGAACSVDISIIITNVIWIDPEVETEEINQYAKELETNVALKVKLFQNIDDAIEHMKEIKFQETKIIVNGGLYSEFIEKIKENISDLYIAPKIIVFTSDTKNFMKTNDEYKSDENTFYKFGGVVNNFRKIQKFLKNEREDLIEIENKPKFINESDDIQLLFEYIDTKEKLMIPMFYKTLIGDTSNDNMKKYTTILYNTYSTENDEIKSLLYSIEPMKEIPTEILAKFYARLYTISNNFRKDISTNLNQNKTKGFLPYIKTLYEGIRLKSLPLSSSSQLYKAIRLPNEEIKTIRGYLKKKVKHLPGVIVYSKTFISFTKDRTSAETAITHIPRETKFSKVLFVLEKNNNIGYDFATNFDIEAVSYFTNQKDALFFPFSSFEVRSIKEIHINKEIVLEIKLLYLNKYIGFIEKDATIINEGKALPDSEFKKQICEFGLIKKETFESTDTKALYQNYKNPQIKKENKEDNKKKEKKEDDNSDEQESDKDEN